MYCTQYIYLYVRSIPWPIKGPCVYLRWKRSKHCSEPKKLSFKQQLAMAAARACLVVALLLLVALFSPSEATSSTSLRRRQVRSLLKRLNKPPLATFQVRTFGISHLVACKLANYILRLITYMIIN